jgi:L-ascorbate metabolism protein UlaG (beta-lactamase superfamily)
MIEEGGAKLLIDPGNFSKGFEDVQGVDGILITHQHQDHLLPDNLKKVLAKNPEARIYADEESAGQLAVAGMKAQAVHEGEEFDVKGVKVEVFGKKHITVHPDIPVVADVGYLVAERLFHPGDAYTVPDKPVEILAAPAGGPWLKVEEAIDYVRAVKPKLAFPIHDAVLSPEGQRLNYWALQTYGQAGEFRPVGPEGSTEA